jgi:hypothetical protein
MSSRLPLKLETFTVRIIEPNSQISHCQKVLDETRNLNFQQKLAYYNKNIRSLACENLTSNLHFQGYTHYEKRVVSDEFYCGCETCRTNFNNNVTGDETDNSLKFSFEKESLFYVEREKEIKRIEESLGGFSKYKINDFERVDYEKDLRSLIGIKGFSLVDNLKIYKAFDPKKRFTKGKHNVTRTYQENGLERTTTYKLGKYDVLILDLEPINSNEIGIYNKILKEQFDAEYRTANVFTEKYKGLVAAKEIKQLITILQDSNDRIQLLKNLKSEMATYFDYPAFRILKVKSDSDREREMHFGLLWNNNDNLEWQKLAFRDLYLNTFDHEPLKIKTTNYYLCLEHVEQCVELYVFLNFFSDNPETINAKNFKDTKRYKEWLESLTSEKVQSYLGESGNSSKITTQIKTERLKQSNQKSLSSLLEDAKIYSKIKKAISNLGITKDSSERVITGFIDGVKNIQNFPQISTTDIFKAIYIELVKPLDKNSKPRYDKKTYQKSYAKTKKYFDA